MDFSKAGTGEHLIGLLKEGELYGMLEASDFGAVDKVSPFLGFLVDGLCGLSRIDEVTSAMTKYVDMVNLVFRRHMDFEWTKKTIQILRQRIRSFEKKERFAFGKYQAAGLLTQKWHAHDLLCEANLEVGNIESLHGGIHEASHKRFKLIYDRSSWRRRGAIDEIVSMQNAENTEQFYKFIGNRDSSVTMKGCVEEACKGDSRFLTGNKERSFSLN